MADRKMITDDERALWRTMAELAAPANLGGEPMLRLLDENEELRKAARGFLLASFDDRTDVFTDTLARLSGLKASAI